MLQTITVLEIFLQIINGFSNMLGSRIILNVLLFFL